MKRPQGLADGENGLFALERDHSGHRLVPVENDHRLAAANAPDITAEVRLEFGNADIRHDQIIVTGDQSVNANTPPSSS